MRCSRKSQFLFAGVVLVLPKVFIDDGIFALPRIHHRYDAVTMADIKKAFQTKAHQTHPDHNLDKEVYLPIAFIECRLAGNSIFKIAIYLLCVCLYDVLGLRQCR